MSAVWPRVGAPSISRTCRRYPGIGGAPAASLGVRLAHVPTYRMSQAAALLGVSVDTLRRWADAGRLATSKDPGGQRQVDGRDLAAFAIELAASTPAPPAIGAQSARNRFPGIVTRVLRNEVVAQVEIQAGPHRLVSLLTAEAVDELGLAPGMLAVAVVKATNVVVELPARS